MRVMASASQRRIRPATQEGCAAHTGERDAVGRNSGQPVTHSGPGLRRPTLPATAGRKPEARPPVLYDPAQLEQARAAGLAQPKSGPGCGAGSPASAEREAPALNLDQFSLSELRRFF